MDKNYLIISVQLNIFLTLLLPLQTYRAVNRGAASICSSPESVLGKLVSPANCSIFWDGANSVAIVVSNWKLLLSVESTLLPWEFVSWWVEVCRRLLGIQSSSRRSYTVSGAFQNCIATAAAASAGGEHTGVTDTPHQDSGSTPTMS